MSNGYVTKAKRKLLSRHALKRAHELYHLGVPVARILNDMDLDISRPALARLIDNYAAINTNGELSDVVCGSLFPPWLMDIPAVQTNPEGWRYEGRFPFGRWLEPQ